MQEPIICAQCRAGNPPNNKFCGECGSRLPLASPEDGLPDWLREQPPTSATAAPPRDAPAVLNET